MGRLGTAAENTKKPPREPASVISSQAFGAVSRFVLLGGISIILSLAAIGPGSIASAQGTGGLYVFGDSSSDTGNVYELLLSIGLTSEELSPQFSDGRLTNGANWVDYVASPFGWDTEALLRGGSNWAFGGSTFGMGDQDLSFLVPGLTVPNVGQTIVDFAASGGSISADDFVILAGGQNDALQPLESGTYIDPSDTLTDLRENLDRLYALGARRIIVPTLVALEYSPSVTAYGASDLTAEWLAAYEAGMEEVIAQFRADNPDADVIVPDFGALVRAIIANPSAYGFTNVTDAAYDEATGTAVANADEHLWWDDHTTTLAQRLFAQRALGELNGYYFPGQVVHQSAAASLQMSRLLAQENMERIAQRLHHPRGEGQLGTPWSTYFVPFAVWGHQSSDPNASGFVWNAEGFDLGVENTVNDATLLGSSFDFLWADLNGNGDCGDASAFGFGVHPYLRREGSRFYCHLGGGFDWSDNTAMRPILLTAEVAKADFATESWDFWMETGLSTQADHAATWTPILGVDMVNSRGASTRETGTSLMNSELQFSDYSSIRHVVGLRASTAIPTRGPGKWNARALAGWRHEYLDTVTASTTTLAAKEWYLQGPQSGRDILDLELEMTWLTMASGELRTFYDAELSSGAFVQGVALQWLRRY